MKIKRFNEAVDTDKQLEMGIKVEKEHSDIYNELQKYIEKKNISMPWSEKDFYKKIAESHIREIPDYYNRLSDMEKKAK